MRRTVYLALPNRPAADSWHLDKRRIRALPLCWATLAPANRGCSGLRAPWGSLLHRGEATCLHTFKTLHLPSLCELLSYTYFWKILISPLAGEISFSQQRSYAHKTCKSTLSYMLKSVQVDMQVRYSRLVISIVDCHGTDSAPAHQRSHMRICLSMMV